METAAPHAHAPPAPREVNVVVVTYGRRWPFLHQTITAALAGGAGRVTVVSNGADNVLPTRLAAHFDNRVTLVSLPENLGSAGGFHAGIRAALAQELDFICLLDDDNAMHEACLYRLLATWWHAGMADQPGRSAVLALREAHYTADALIDAASSPRTNDYLGFHLAELPAKAWRRLSGKPGATAPEAAGDVRWAPWGGLLFHRAVPQSIGLPRSDFVLYNDDTEWTLRLVGNGGRIVLDPKARIEDADCSGHEADLYPDFFSALLHGSTDWRMYYEFRNRVCLDGMRQTRGLVRRVNKTCFWLLLDVAALVWQCLPRLRLLLAAKHDGESGRLGLNPAYPLPASAKAAR